MGDINISSKNLSGDVNNSENHEILEEDIPESKEFQKDLLKKDETFQATT